MISSRTVNPYECNNSSTFCECNKIFLDWAIRATIERDPNKSSRDAELSFTYGFLFKTKMQFATRIMRAIVKSTGAIREATGEESTKESWKEMREETGERPAIVLYRALRDCSIPLPITIKCLFRNIQSVRWSIIRRVRARARRNMQSSHVQWCARGRMRRGKLNRVEAWGGPLQPACADASVGFADVAWPSFPRRHRTQRAKPSSTVGRRSDTGPRLGPNRTHRSALGLRIAGPGRLVYHHLPWWSCWVSSGLSA